MLNNLFMNLARYIECYEYDNVDVLPETVPPNIDAKFGDIIAFREYRESGTVFVGENNKLIPNCDFGYLSIPLEITTHFSNAPAHYKDVLQIGK